MRLRLLIRRLTVSAPRVSVRSALPWPFRWIVLATVFGFCAAIALWAFEFGKDIAGLDRGTKAELQQARAALVVLRQEIAALQTTRDQAQSVANTADTLLLAEKASFEKLAVLNKQLEATNRSLRDDLVFFEQLIPAVGGGSLAIRSLQAERLNDGELKWQVLLVQAVRDPPEFDGQLVLSFAGFRNGKPWMATLPTGSQAIKFKQYGRIEGIFELPAQVVVKSVTAKVMVGAVVKVVQSVKL
jgi:hypothetical protein